MRGIPIYLFFFVFGVSVFGQTQTQPTPNPEAEIRRQRALMDERQREMQTHSQRLRDISDLKNGGTVSKKTALDIHELYRKPSSSELKKLRPLDEDLKKYSSFLKRRNTGIVRLEPYAACGDSTRVLKVSDRCLEYTLPGHGSDFSFRERSYRIGRLADLRFDADSFSSPGICQQAIFGGVGDLPLEEIRLNTAGVPFLSLIEPPTTAAAAADMTERFRAGIEQDGFYYASGVKAVENMTYVLRSIAYRGTVARSVGGVVYDELELDERADVIVAFRIIRKHDSGGITIIWVELDRKRSPELETNKREMPGRNPFAEARSKRF